MATKLLPALAQNSIGGCSPLSVRLQAPLPGISTAAVMAGALVAALA